MATPSAQQQAPHPDPGSGCPAAGVPAPLRGELRRMAAPASRAPRRESEPKVGRLPEREHAVWTHKGGAQVPGTLRDCKWRKRRPRGSHLPFPSRGRE